MSEAQEKECMFECGKVLIFDPELPSPPYREKDTKIHHTFQRCYECKPEGANERFAKYHERKKRWLADDFSNQH